MDQEHRDSYWRRNVRIMAVLLAIWAFVSFGLGIILAEPLNKIVLAGFPLGFWFAQQGSILVFLALIAVYVKKMDSLDEEYGITEHEAEVRH